jgi:dienelactone hydrolase
VSSPPSTPLNDFGNLHGALKAFRATHRRQLSWHMSRDLGFAEWKHRARAALREALSYEVVRCDLAPQIVERREHADFIAEKVVYQTTPWFSVPAWFLRPKMGRPPFPAVYLMHEWGGNILWGKERVIRFGDEPQTLVEHQATYHGGRGLANELVRRGYAVLVADAFYFGERGPRGFGGIPQKVDPRALTTKEAAELHAQIVSTLYLAVRYLMWAGTTWAGVNFWDDARGIDYLAGRPEVDPSRIACTGLSGGAWRTNLLAALDDRIRASASVMWMSTGDALHDYNVAGAVGTFCLLPGLWQQMDVPDLSVMAAPSATLVVSGTEDPLFPREGKEASARHIREGFRWAGCPGQFRDYSPRKPHCFDVEVQEAVFSFFGEKLPAP